VSFTDEELLTVDDAADVLGRWGATYVQPTEPGWGSGVLPARPPVGVSPQWAGGVLGKRAACNG
jgi:hypothetical protein